MWSYTDPLGHAGLTVAVVFAANLLLGRVAGGLSHGKRRVPTLAAPVGSRREERRSVSARRWTLDYRLVIIGSLLPDLLDKSFGLLFLPEMINPSGRLIGHTLLFHALLLGATIIAVLLVRFARSPALPVFTLASAGHLLLDRMWESPITLLWPLHGRYFGAAEFNLSPDWLQWVQTGGGTALVDGTGALVLLLFAIRLYRRRNVLGWLKTGRG